MSLRTPTRASVKRHTQRIDRLQGFTARGRTVLDLAYADAGPGWFGMGLHRGVLFETLLGEVRNFLDHHRH